MNRDKSPLERVKLLMEAGYPIVYVVSWEERRVESIIATVVRTFFKERKLVRWSVTEGFGKGAASPEAALDAIYRNEQPGVFLLRDFHPFLLGNARIVRRFRDLYRVIGKRSGQAVFIISPTLCLPEDLQKEIVVLDLPLPSELELGKCLDEVVSRAHAERGIPLELSEEDRRALTRALLGMTFDEARFSLAKALAAAKAVDAGVIPSVIEDKAAIVRKTGILQFVPARFAVTDVGGLDALKKWLHVRRGFFSREAEDYQLTAPRGILLMGVSGCGKSLAVQTVSSYWKLPLFRLELNQLFSSESASPEETLRKTFKILDAVAPCVLWIDEIEGAFSGYGTKGGADSSRVFASFLTWMQEKESEVFVAATANRIDLLPPEILRKGRFDQIFFVDLPTEAERERILRIHLKRREVDLETIELEHLAAATKGFNGAECEQVVISAMFDAYAEKRPLVMQDLYRAVSATVPLSKTMYERIKELKKWAHDRAVSASTDTERERL